MHESLEVRTKRLDKSIAELNARVDNLAVKMEEEKAAIIAHIAARNAELVKRLEDFQAVFAQEQEYRRKREAVRSSTLCRGVGH